MKASLACPFESDWPYLWIDASCVKVRRNDRIVSGPVIVAVGVNSDGRREALGMDINFRGRDVLDRVPAQIDSTRPAQRQACHLGRP